MSKYPKLLIEAGRLQWAITTEAMEGIVKALDEGIDPGDYERFHGASEDAHKSLAVELGEPVDGMRFASVRDGIGSLTINGPLIPRGDAITEISGITTFDRLTAEFRELESRLDVSAIVLVIDSPGGTVVGTSEFAAMVKASKKPTFAYVFGMAASAAYWIASATDAIISSDVGEVGSIGAVLTVYQQDNENQIEIVSSQSPLKRVDAQSKEGRAVLQSLVDQVADVFINTVANNRGVSRETVLTDFGQGEVMLSKAASAAGMIDGESPLFEFMASLAESDVEFSRWDSVNSLIAETITNAIASGELQFETVDNVNENEQESMNGFETRTVERKQMTSLKDFLAENPEAQLEFEEAINKAADAGAEEIESGSVEDRDLDHALKIIASDYPEKIKAIAEDVIRGERDGEDLKTAIELFDSIKASAEADAAIEDSEELPATRGEDAPPISADGMINTAADVSAAAASIRALRGDK